MGGVYGSSKAAASRVAKFAAELPQRLAKALAPKIDQRLRDMATNETDVYGAPFAPLAASTIKRKARSMGGPLILTRTNAMWNGTHARYAGRRLVITYGPAAKHAQDGDQGRGNRPPRLVAPTHGIPATWRADMREAQAEVAKGGAK